LTVLPASQVVTNFHYLFPLIINTYTTSWQLNKTTACNTKHPHNRQLSEWQNET